MLWLWNPGQRSLKVIESGATGQTGCGFLLMFYGNFVPKLNRFEMFDFEKCRDLKIGVKGHSNHQNQHVSICHLRFPINVP